MENGKITPNDALNTENPMIAKAKQQLNSMVLNDLERKYYETQQKANLEHNYEREEIEAEWDEIATEREELEKEKAQFENERFEIVRKLIQTGSDNDFIINITGFSEKIKKKLRKEMQ